VRASTNDNNLADRRRAEELNGRRVQMPVECQRMAVCCKADGPSTNTKYETTQEPSQQAIALSSCVRRCGLWPLWRDQHV